MQDKEKNLKNLYSFLLPEHTRKKGVTLLSFKSVLLYS